jgi:N-acetylglucosamine malate deacetylase 1
MFKIDSSDTLLVIAPHPDDEVIGCGGLIQKVKNAGGKAYVIFLTNGDTNDFSKNGPSTASERDIEIENVSKFLEFDGYHIAFEGNDFHLKLDTLGQKKIMEMIERESPYSIEKIKPTIVVFPSVNSYNQDHRLAAMAAHACLRTSSKEKHYIETVISYEFPADFWSLQDEPLRNCFLPLTEEEWKKKIDALKLYKSQWREFPSSRSEKSLTALATLRGGESLSDFAEAFFIHRGVIR